MQSAPPNPMRLIHHLLTRALATGIAVAASSSGAQTTNTTPVPVPENGPGSGEAPAAPVFIDGVKTQTLRGDTIAQDFLAILERYVADTYQSKAG